MNMKRLAIWAMAIALLPTAAAAQDHQDDNDKKAKTEVEAALVSHYMWRGIDKGGISLQPQLKLEWRGLEVKAQGSTGFDRQDPEELNLKLGYSKWGVNVGVTDYWTSGVDPENRYFFFDDQETAHQVEANIGYTCKYFSLQAYTMVWGNDYKIDGDRAYSTYIELSVPFRAAGLDWDVRAGMTPMESAGYAVLTPVQSLLGTLTMTTKYHFYGEGATCNLASLRATKTLHYKNLNIPVYAELHTNPYLQKANLLVGVKVQAF